jgi:hypothetical protein
MQREGIARERAETECDSKVLLLRGHAFFIASDCIAGYQTSLATSSRRVRGIFVHFVLVLEVAAMGSLEDAPVFA